MVKFAIVKNGEVGAFFKTLEQTIEVLLKITILIAKKSRKVLARGQKLC